MSRLPTMLCVFALLTFGSSRSAHAVFIVLNGGEEVIGFLVDQNDLRVKIVDATTKRERTILRGQISLIRLAAEPDRLEAFSRDNPKDFRNYAEEVAAKAKRDPEARELAIRLYLIAAYLDTGDLGKSSLLGMINLARSSA